MRLMRNVLIVVGIVVIAAVVLQGVVLNGNVTAQEASQPGSVVEDEAVASASDLDVTVSATGTIAPVRQVTLAFELSTLPVEEVLVDDGQYVEENEVLARLDSENLAMSLRNAEITLDLQKIAYDALVAPPRDVDLDAARAAVDAAQAAVNAAYDTAPNADAEEIARLQAELARNQLWQQQLQRDQIVDPYVPEGIPKNLIPEASDEQKRQLEAGLQQADYGVRIADTNLDNVLSTGPDTSSLGSANAQLVAAQTQLDRLVDGPDEIAVQEAEIQLHQAELAIQQAQTTLDRATLIAPFSGVVAWNDLIVGELPPSTGAIQLIDDSEFFVDLAIDETDIADIQVGQPVDLQLDALPETTVTGHISRVAQTPTRIGQVVTYVARVTLDPTLEPIRVGMNTTATIKVQQLQNVVTLLNRFIRVDRNTQKAYVTIQRDDGRFEEVEVQLGPRNETSSQIISGLEAGQRVVLLPRDESSAFSGS